MDLEESLTSAPFRYALDDVDSDEELEVSLENQKVSIQTKLSIASDQQSKWTVIVGLDGPGSVFINSLENSTATTVGNISRSVEEKEPELKASIMQIANNSTLLIPFDGEVKSEEAVQYAKAILNDIKNRLDKVIVLDSFPAVGYTSEMWGDDLVPPFLRVLQTSTSPSVKGMTLYESPNMIKGLSAAIVNFCEIHSITCYDLLTLQESIYGKLLVTPETLEAYNQGLQKLGLNIKFNDNLMKQVLIARHSGRVDDSHHRLYL